MGQIRIDKGMPIADGIPFDDCHGMPDDMVNFLASRGVVFCTEFRANGALYGGRIVATSQEAAEQVAFGRGLDERIIGTLAEMGE